MNLVSLSLRMILISSLGACALANTDQAESEWRDAISASPSTDTGCFHAAYPAMTWDAVACTTAPNRAFAQIPAGGTQFTVGNGDDYALEISSGLMVEPGSKLSTTARRTCTRSSSTRTS